MFAFRRKQKFGEQTEEEEEPLSSSAVMLCLGKSNQLLLHLLINSFLD